MITRHDVIIWIRSSHFVYYYNLFCHSLCWCPSCALAGHIPCTRSIDQSLKKSQSFCPYTKHLSEDARSSQHADLLDFCQSSSLWYFIFYFFFFWLVEGSSRSPCPTSPSLCFQPPIRGFCRAYFRRYYFDSKSGKCKMFIYGGCSGNRNNFRDKKSCDQTCAGKTNCNSIGHLKLNATNETTKEYLGLFMFLKKVKFEL